MVMDVTPSPQCVGREFVRQYYTLLNEAPQYLHRFYSNNSSFNHGSDGRSVDEQPAVIGQTEIHRKIMSLNFTDCHAKIRYVDSQATIGTAVVVQVTGELSNNQEPLRRFMQTFVLAPQTPNKYYVHNDIFRYQDEVFCETDEEDELAEHEQALANQTHLKQTSPPEQAEQPPLIENSLPQNNYYQQQHRQVNPDPDPQQVSGSSGAVTPEPTLTNGHQEESLSPPSPPAAPQPEQVIRLPTPEPTAEPEPAAPTATDEPATNTHQQSSQQHDNVSAGETQKASWAAHVIEGGPVRQAAVSSSNPPLLGHQNRSPESAFPAASSPEKQGQSMQRPPPMRNVRPGANLTSGGFGDNTGLAGSKPLRLDEGSGGEERARRPERVNYPDSQQVFVGNLPSLTSEFELRNFFRAHGTVLEVRINRNSAHKQAFGFVVFDSEDCAQKILTSKQPLDYGGCRLNIEEKKPRGESRPNSMSRSRRDGRHRGGRGGYAGHPREDGGRSEGRYNNLNKSNNSQRR